MYPEFKKFTLMEDSQTISPLTETDLLFIHMNARAMDFAEFKNWILGITTTNTTSNTIINKQK